VKHFLMTGLAATLALTSLSANAQQAFTAGKPQVGARVGYGIYTGDDLGGDFNPYGIGFGAAGGYTLDMNVHLGASFEYYLGDSTDSPGGEASANIWNLMFEPGYDIAAGETLVIRPQLGLGLSSVNAEVCISLPPPFGDGSEQCADNSESKFAVAPGAMLLIDFGGLYAQAGARYHHIFVDEGNADAFLINAGLGATF
jgi:hypothetical protein